MTLSSFKYDPFGRRIYKSSSAGTSIFASDGDNLIEQTNSSGTAVARYEQGLNIDEPLAMLNSGATSYYHADGLGSVTSLSSSAGSLAQTYTFDSFGRQTGSSGSLTNPFQYTAREFDSETSLYYYRARYYDPNSGRFVSDDPIRIRGGINLYAYVRNDPVRLTDPLGTCPPGQCKVQVLKPNEVPNIFNSCGREGWQLVWAVQCTGVGPGTKDCCIDKQRTYQQACETPPSKFYYIEDVTYSYNLGLCCKKSK